MLKALVSEHKNIIMVMHFDGFWKFGSVFYGPPANVHQQIFISCLENFTEPVQKRALFLSLNWYSATAKRPQCDFYLYLVSMRSM